MSPVGERETRTQRRVAAFLRDALGHPGSPGSRGKGGT